jgi:tetratricopeptide (TPR) repeat protein
MKFKLGICVIGLLILLLVGSFILLTELISDVEQGHVTHAQSEQIAQFHLTPLLQQRFKEIKQAEHAWFGLAKFLAQSDGEVAYQLANVYLSKNNRLPAIAWYKQAVRLNHVNARIALAKIYIENENLNLAQSLLLRLKNKGPALKLLLLIAIEQGDEKFIKANANKLKDDDEFSVFFKKLLRYQVINSGNNFDMANDFPECLATIQPVATSIKDLDYLNHFIETLPTHSLSEYICFSSVKYVSKQKLNCQQEDSAAIKCNEDFWLELSLSDQIRYIMVLVPRGGANVNSGIMYVDKKDSAEVFYHEAAHLFGFIDEYPLPKEHFRCAGVQLAPFSHNISVLPKFYQGSHKQVRTQILTQLAWADSIDVNTPIVTKTSKGWKLGTPEQFKGKVGAFIAETCLDEDFLSIKPLSTSSQLRYYEHAFPTFYLTLLKNDFARFIMPSYKSNVLRALAEEKDE